jgi:hypothetical protein
MFKIVTMSHENELCTAMSMLCVNMLFIICHIVNEIAEKFFSSSTWNVFLIPQHYM